MAAERLMCVWESVRTKAQLEMSTEEKHKAYRILPQSQKNYLCERTRKQMLCKQAPSRQHLVQYQVKRGNQQEQVSTTLWVKNN